MAIQLANQLGVSRTPIREAIRTLEQEGLAVMIPRKGAQVARMDEKDMGDVLEIRDVLDALAVETACERMTEEELAELVSATDEFEKAVKKGNASAIAQADVAFHDVIYRATKNPKLETILNNLREQMYRYRLEYIKDKSVYENLLAEHRAITEGFVRKDKDYLINVMHEHLKNQVDAVSEAIRKQ